MQMDQHTETEEFITGAEAIVRSLVEHDVDTIFGYPGGAVLPIYDALFYQNGIRHILCRHEQAAGHAAEGYARSTGKPGVILVTSGPGVTNTITPLTDALLDSIPIICLSGQVPTHLIGTDAFQECDTVGITRPCTKHNWLLRSADEIPGALGDAFYIATHGRPGPVVVDVPKDVQNQTLRYRKSKVAKHRSYTPVMTGDKRKIAEACALLKQAKRPIFYTGGGVINSGPEASRLLTKLVVSTGVPVTSTLMGLGAFPASKPQWLGMLGMHGTFEANNAMHDCDVMVCLGARFDDRVTGRIDAFSPGSKKIHIDIDPSSVNKNIKIDVPIIGDCTAVLRDFIECWESETPSRYKAQLCDWWLQIEKWRKRKCLSYQYGRDIIMPQDVIVALREAINPKNTFVTTDVGQHQMWVAQYFGFEKPNRLMTSGGLGTMGYGLPAAIGTQLAHPGSAVVCVTGDASILMNNHELATAAQYRLPVKVLILNNRYMGMVRQWQEALHESRYAESYSEVLPDFVAMANAFGATGFSISRPETLSEGIRRMLGTPGVVVVDCLVKSLENCLPAIPPGRAHNQMILADNCDGENLAASEDGKSMV